MSEIIQTKSNGRGGRREGAGRPKGSATLKTRQKANEILEDGGLTPLDYMLSVLRDESLAHEDRMDAAKSAAPYIHPRLAATENTHKIEKTLGEIFDEADALVTTGDPAPSGDEG